MPTLRHGFTLIGLLFQPWTSSDTLDGLIQQPEYTHAGGRADVNAGAGIPSQVQDRNHS